jgi:predicted  nucleic acid-binding Zn-ribbon protein
MKTWYEGEDVKLKISSVKMKHEGTYTCVATNSAGKDECTAFITVEGQYVLATKQKQKQTNKNG